MNAYSNIEDYLNGELMGEDLLAFLESMRVDPELRLAVEHHQSILSQFETLRLRRKVKNNLMPPPGRSEFGTAGIKKYMSAAAALAMLITAVYFWVGKRNQPLLADAPAQTDSLPGAQPDSRVENTPPPAELAQNRTEGGNEKIASADYALYRETVSALKYVNYTFMDVHERKDTNLESKLNKVIDLLRNDDQVKAVPILEELLDSRIDTSGYREDAEWLLSVALIMHDRKRCSDMLRKMTENPAHSYRVKAIHLLEKLE